MIDRFQLQKLSDLPIESVASRLGLQVTRHKSLCPFHDDSHPSLTFNVRRNRYKCFVCDAHGGVIDLAMHVLGRDFKETIHWLADSSNIILSEWKPAQKPVPELVAEPVEAVEGFDAAKYLKYFERPFINQLAGEFLFEKRHLHSQVVKWCRLTSWRDRKGIDWLQIPYFDIDGHLTGIQNRRLTSVPETVGEPVEPRFRFPYGSQCHIYNLPVLKMLRPGEPLFIAEGCSDCWSLLSSGHKAIAIPSATLLKPQDLEILKGLNLHMYPDQDLPGERLFVQLKEFLDITRHSLPSDCKDYSDYYCACPELVEGINVKR